MLLLQPVGLALDVDVHAVVQEPIEDGGGDDRVFKDLAPLAEAAVGGQDRRGPLRSHIPTGLKTPNGLFAQRQHDFMRQGQRRPSICG